jgi:ferredoxin
MEIGGKRVLVCDCEGTMPLDGAALGRACGAGAASVHKALCRAQIAEVEKAGREAAPLLVACTQEAPLFLETLADRPADHEVRFVNIRERAGWSAEGAKAMPKIAALLAEAALDIPPTPTVMMKSAGALLVLGIDERAIEAAKQVAGRLDPVILLTAGTEVVPPRLMDVPVFRGRVVGAEGRLGAFRVRVADHAAAVPSSRDRLVFGPSAPEGLCEADLILDLRGGPSLFPGGERRDGYFRPDPGNPALVQRALLELTDLVGEFEKPRYVHFRPELCAHARSKLVGCTRCLDRCPTGAIAPGTDSVTVDPYVCGGCGQCASVCPTGAAAYGLPAGDALHRRLRTLLATYHGAGGADAVLLVHDTRHGEEMIDAIARFGRGLPARVLPFAVNQATQVGLDFLLLAVAYGAGTVRLLVDPAKGDEAATLAEQVALAEAILAGLGYGSGRLAVAAAADSAAVEADLWRLPSPPAVPAAAFLPLGGRRSLIFTALRHLHAYAPAAVEMLALPAGAPFGQIQVRVEGCTLCLSCVGACPTGALRDNPEKPQLRFQEESCIQCGLCRATCPEKVVALAPRLDFTEAAHAYRILKEEEPFACIRCGKPFGTRSAIERLVERLAGHSMFAGPGRLDLIRMCDNCRVLAQMEQGDHPMAAGPPPRTRTTDDYLREREELRRQAAAANRAAGLADDDT